MAVGNLGTAGNDELFGDTELNLTGLGADNRMFALAGDGTMYAWGQGHAVLHGGPDDDRVTVWCEPDPDGPSPLPGAPNQIFDVLLGAGRDVMEFNAWGDGSIGWARLDDLDRGQDRLAVSVYDEAAGRTIETAEAFNLLDANRDGRLTGDDGATFFGEVFADEAGLHLRLQDDWLSLAGETTLVASDFEMTAVA
jgi:Ca2+-binding RTX toxin-like protein